MSLAGANDVEKLVNLTLLTYKEQSTWFLNAFWGNLADEAEKIWLYAHKCNELDMEKHENGNALDELNAHRLLEHFGETLTVRAMRERLRSTGAVSASERFKNVPLIHYLVCRYEVDFHRLVNASQGDNQAQIEEAQRKLAEVQKAFQQMAAAAAEAKAKEQESKAAQAELEQALSELKQQEDAFKARTDDLTRRSEEGGIVSRNKAKAELAQHLAEDPLPLRRAKITTEAAVKKAERASAAAEAARIAAEDAVEQTRAKLAEAEAFLEEVKAMGGSAEGTLWWMDREIYEHRKYLPVAKGGVRK